MHVPELPVRTRIAGVLAFAAQELKYVTEVADGEYRILLVEGFLQVCSVVVLPYCRPLLMQK